jgi:hypothetical protein
MTGRQEYDRNMTGRQDDRQDDRQRILDEYMIDSYQLFYISHVVNKILAICPLIVFLESLKRELC